jgi:signal transduction histidine kinase/ActR/RegA family two-component response regulator
MGWFNRSPIRWKLRLVVLASCAAALILAGLFLTQFQLRESRLTLTRDTTVLAEILAKNVRGAIAFDDASDARAKLETLQSESHVMAACLYVSDGGRFAEYLRAPGPGTCPERPGAAGSLLSDESLLVVRPVLLNGKEIGAIQIQSDLEGIKERLRVFLATGLVVLLGALAFAMGLASRLERSISGPVLALANTAQIVADREDFSVRAVRQAEDEVGVLTDAFNAMLARIEDRESALQSAIVALEAENTERRVAEERVQSQLAKLELLNRITRAIGERQDLESIFQVVIRSLEDHLPVDFCCICLFDEAARVLSVTGTGVRGEALGKALMLTDKAELPIDDSLAPCLLGSLLYEPDTGLALSPFTQRLAGADLRSMVVAPLLVESRVFGLLVAARREPDAFQSGERQFLRQLSEHAGLASHQAQLYGALQQAYDDLRQTQQAVMQQERLRALGQMASGIAHDINNSISPVALYAELLLERERNLSPEGRENLETIQRAIDDVAETVARMREFYRDNEPQVLLTPVQLNRLVPQVMDLTRVRWSDMAQKTGVSIVAKVELTPDAPPILGSESELREALTNLVFNAVDAMPAGGTLYVRTRIREPSPLRAGNGGTLVCLEVTDSGVGMDEETRRRCLEPFFTTKGERGTGLGLAMVYGSAKRHGAEVEIESALGVGTTVRLSFAAAAGADTARPAAGSAFPHLPHLKVLAVDDDPLVLKALRECLEGDGHTVAIANDGREGIEIFRLAFERADPFAVVITDLGMPYVDGRRVAAFVKSASPATPVLMLTGWGQRLRADGEIPPHVDHLLSKPPKLRELREVLARHFPPARS